MPTSYNLSQIHTNNPITTNTPNDLMYFVQSGADAGMKFSDFAAQLSGGVTAPQIQNQTFTYFPDTGAADAYVITPSPAISAYQDGQAFWFLPANTNLTQTPLININGLGNRQLSNAAGAALNPGDIQAGNPVYFIIGSGGFTFFVQNPWTNNITLTSQAIFNIADCSDAGVVNAYVLTLDTGITLNQYNNGQSFTFSPANTNTGASTISVGGLGVVNLVDFNGNPLVSGAIVVNSYYEIIYNGGLGKFVVINPSVISSNFITGVGRADQSYSLQTPSTGFSITIANNTQTLILNPAGTLATGTVTMPAAPIDGQEIRVCSSQIITGLTVSANAGQSIEGAPTTIGVGGGFGYIYNLANTKWFRLY